MQFFLPVPNKESGSQHFPSPPCTGGLLQHVRVEIQGATSPHGSDERER